MTGQAKTGAVSNLSSKESNLAAKLAAQENIAREANAEAAKDANSTVYTCNGVFNTITDRGIKIQFTAGMYVISKDHTDYEHITDYLKYFEAKGRVVRQ